MAFGIPRSAVLHPTILAVLFVVTLNYSGPGFNLHWLSLGGVLVLLWLAYLVARTDGYRVHLSGGWLTAVIVCYVSWLFVAPFFSTYHYASSTTAMGLAVLPFVFMGWLLVPAASKDKTWRYTWGVLLATCLALATWGIGDFIFHRVRAHAVFLDPNAYAALINLFLLPVAYKYLNAPQAKGVRSSLILASIALLALGQFVSLSRGALLALLLTLPLLLWQARHSQFFRWRSVVLLSVLALAYLGVKLSPVGPNNTLENFLAAPEHYIESDAGIQERLLLWKATWTMFQDTNPLTGNGLGSFKIHYAAYRNEHETSLGNFAHNDYLQALHDGGVIQFTFFVVLTVLAPLWILRKHDRSNRHSKRNDPDIFPGLMLGLISISIHALVNFIHFVGPMIFLSGLYLARSWESVQHWRELKLPIALTSHITPWFLKGLFIIVLAFPTAVLAIDGIIFKLFATEEAFHARFEPSTRFALINLALSVRPANPMPRILLVRALLSGAEKTDSAEDKEMLLTQAEHETNALSADAPALAIGQHFFMGKIFALRGGPENLMRARAHLEQAVKLVPPATGMRLELVKVYQQAGEEYLAYRTVMEAKKWIKLEVDLPSLAAFASEARLISQKHGDVAEAEFWLWVYERLEALGHTG